MATQDAAVAGLGDQHDADKEWIDVNKSVDKNSSGETEALPSPSSTVHGIAEVKAGESLNDAAPIHIKHDDDTSAQPPQETVADIPDPPAHAEEAEGQVLLDRHEDKSAGSALHSALDDANTSSMTEHHKRQASQDTEIVDKEPALEAGPAEHEEAPGGKTMEMPSSPENTEMVMDEPAEPDLSATNAGPLSTMKRLDKSASATPVSDTSDDIPFSAYEHALKKEASLRKSKELTEDGSSDGAALTKARRGDASGSTSIDEMRTSKDSETTPRLARPVSPRKRESSIFVGGDSEEYAATLSQIDYGIENHDADEQSKDNSIADEGEASKDVSTDTQGPEGAPPPPPKSPRHQPRYVLPIGGPGASGPRPELIALLRAPASTTSLQSQRSAASSADSASQSASATSHSKIGSRSVPKKAGPSSPRRRSSLPKLLVATAVYKGKGRARAKSVGESSSESDSASTNKHRKGSVNSTLAPLVEEDRERGSDEGRSRPASAASEASMRTAQEDLDDGPAKDSEDEYKEAKSSFTTRFAAPAMAAIGSALQSRKAPVRRIRGKRSAEAIRPAFVSESEDDDGMEHLKPVSPKRPPRSPRSAAKNLQTPTKKTSTSTLTVDGQVFAVDEETDEYEDVDVDSTPKASNIRKGRASMGDLGRRERANSATSSPGSPIRQKAAPTFDSSLFADSGEQMKRPVRAEHEPMIYDEDEMEDVPPPGSYANHPPSKRRLAEAAELVLYDDTGTMLKFGTIFEKRRTLIIFLRHWLCPFCQMFAQSIQAVDPLPLEKAEIDMVVVGQGHWHVTKSYKDVMKIPDFVRMYADPSRKIYNALGMTLRTNDQGPACSRPDYQTMGVFKASMKAMKKGIVDMPLRVPGDLKLLGGEFVLGPGLQCSFTHRMVTTRGHLDLPRVLEQVGCDLSLKSPDRMANERANKPGSVHSENRRGVRRAARRIARRARPATPREALAVKSSRAAALAAQHRTLNTQRTSGSLARQYATSTLVRGENGDYIVDVGPPRLSGDGISLANTTPKRASPHRRQASGTLRPPLPLSSSSSAYAAAFARQRNYSTTPKMEDTEMQTEQLASKSTPALLAGVPPRTRAASHEPTSTAAFEDAVQKQVSQSYDVPASDSLYNPAVLQPSAFATPRKPLAPRSMQTTPRARAPSVGRNLADEVKPQARTSSMRGGTPIGAMARAGSTDMLASRSTSSSGHSANRLPPVPLRYASNAPALPLSAAEKRVQDRPATSTSSNGHSTHEPTGNPLLSSVMMNQGPSYQAVNLGSEGHQSDGHGLESQYASPLLSGVLSASSAYLNSPTVSSSGHGAPVRQHSYAATIKPTDREEETEYKRLTQTQLERQRFASNEQDSYDDPSTRASFRGQPSKQMGTSTSDSKQASVTSPLLAALGGRTPKGRIISLHADEFNEPESQHASIGGSRVEYGTAEAAPPVPPVPEWAQQGNVASRAPQPAFVPAFASILAAEEARKAASSTGHSSYESAVVSDFTHTPQNQPAPWHDAVFGGNPASALFAGMPPKSAAGVSRENSTASSTYKASPQVSARYYNVTSPMPTASSATSSSFLDDLNTIDGYQSHMARNSASMDATRTPESSYRGTSRKDQSQGMSQLDSGSSLSSDFGEPSLGGMGPLFAGMSQTAQPASQFARRASADDGERQPSMMSPLFAAAAADRNAGAASPVNAASPRRPQRAYTPSASAAILSAGNSSNGHNNRLSSFAEEDEDDASPQMPANLALFSAQRVR